MPSRDSMPVERRTVRAMRLGRIALDVDELVLADALVGDREPSRGDEPVGGCGGKPELVGAALGGQAAASRS